MYRKTLFPTNYLFIHSFAFGGHLTPRHFFGQLTSQKQEIIKNHVFKKHNTHKNTQIHKKNAVRASATTVTLGMRTKPHFQRLLEQLDVRIICISWGILFQGIKDYDREGALISSTQ